MHLYALLNFTFSLLSLLKTALYNKQVNMLNDSLAHIFYLHLEIFSFCLTFLLLIPEILSWINYRNHSLRAYIHKCGYIFNELYTV